MDIRAQSIGKHEKVLGTPFLVKIILKIDDFIYKYVTSFIVHQNWDHGSSLNPDFHFS